MSHGFILYRRGIRYIGKSSCFFLAIKSTIGATVGYIVFGGTYRMISYELLWRDTTRVVFLGYYNISPLSTSGAIVSELEDYEGYCDGWGNCDGAGRAFTGAVGFKRNGRWLPYIDI